MFERLSPILESEDDCSGRAETEGRCHRNAKRESSFRESPSPPQQRRSKTTTTTTTHRRRRRRTTTTLRIEFGASVEVVPWEAAALVTTAAADKAESGTQTAPLSCARTEEAATQSASIVCAERAVQVDDNYGCGAPPPPPPQRGEGVSSIEGGGDEDAGVGECELSARERILAELAATLYKKEVGWVGLS